MKKPTYEQLELLIENQRRQIESQDRTIQQIIEARDAVVEMVNDRDARIADLEAQIDQMHQDAAGEDI